MASAREAADDAGQQRRPRVRLELGGGGPQREHEHGDPAEPRAHREHVHDVRRQQHRDRLLHARVAAERGQQGERRTAGRRARRASASRARAQRRAAAGAVAGSGGPPPATTRTGSGACGGGAMSRPRSGRVASTISTSTQASAPTPQAVPKRVPSTSVNVSGRAADQNELPSPTAPWRTIAASADTSPAIAAISSRRSSRAVNARERRPAGASTASRKISAPSPSAIAPYWKPRATDSALLVIEPLVPPPASSSSSDSDGRSGLADGEDEPARDRVAVGRDDAERRRVGAVAEAGLELDRDLGALAARVERLADLHLLAGGVEHPQRAEAGLDRLVELEHDLRRRGVELRAPLRDGRLQRGVRERRRRQGEQRREGERERALHHASTTSSPRGRSARRRTKNTASESTITSAAKPKIAPIGSEPSSSGTHVSVPAIVALLVADLHRDLPVVELRLDVLVLQLRRIALAHPVRAMVVPLEPRRSWTPASTPARPEGSSAPRSRPGGPR